MKVSLWAILLFLSSSFVTAWLVRNQRRVATTDRRVTAAGTYNSQQSAVGKTKLCALKDGAEEKILQLRDEYVRLQVEADGAQNDRVQQLKRILDAVDALKEIEEDLQNCEAQKMSEDASMREKAKAFYGEFSSIKNELEAQLNKML